MPSNKAGFKKARGPTPASRIFRRHRRLQRHSGAFAPWQHSDQAPGPMLLQARQRAISSDLRGTLRTIGETRTSRLQSASFAAPDSWRAARRRLDQKMQNGVHHVTAVRQDETGVCARHMCDLDTHKFMPHPSNRLDLERLPVLILKRR